MDVFVLGGRRLESTPPEASNRLYHNNRDGTFTDVTEQAGLKDSGWANGVCVGDYDNDGFEDLFITYYGQNKLYRNNGNGTFTDVTKRAGLLHPVTRFSTGCTFVDYNRDGLLDLFVSNYLDFDMKNAPKPSVDIPSTTNVSRSIAAHMPTRPANSSCIEITAMELLPMFPKSPASPSCATHMD